MANLTRKELSEALRGLNPAWFGLVMATGIVGLAAYVQDVPYVPDLLMWANVLFYALLSCLYLARLVVFPRDFFGGFRQHMSAMGYFTVVAGTGVLGAQILQVGGYQTGAGVLWVVALLLWLFVVYAVPVALVAQSEGKPRLEEGIQGNWLLWTVGTASVALLGAQVAPQFGEADLVMIWSFLIWLVSLVFYLCVIVMIVQRLFFHDLTAGDLHPTYWINMGAVAITTLAGATLLRAGAQPPLIERLEPFITGLTLLSWVTATWWIPWLFVMFFWRHVILRQPAWFMPGWWGLVFPLGMYTTATTAIAQTFDLPAVFDGIAGVFVWIAIAAWTFTFVDMLITLWRFPLASGST